MLAGASHVARPGFWRRAVELMADQREAGLTLYALLHLLPGLLLLSAVPPDSWRSWALVIVGAAYLLKASLLLLAPSVMARSMRRGVRQPDRSWRLAGLGLVALATLAIWEAAA